MVSIVGPRFFHSSIIPAMKHGRRSSRNLGSWESSSFSATRRSWMDPASVMLTNINGSQLLQEFFFCFLAQSSEVSNSQSERYGDGWPLDLDGRDSLREFRLWAFFFYFLTQSFEVSNSQSERSGDAWPLDLDGRDSLQEFRLRAFFFYLLTQSSEVSNSRSERSGDAWPLDLDD
jgi:hypothetical protein